MFWGGFTEENAVQAKQAERARGKVNYAVRKGKLPRPDSLLCACGSQAGVYHHPNGYNGKNALDVVASCYKCHRAIHRHERPKKYKQDW